MTGTSPAPSGQVLLGVFAHPDDESLACGGLLARAAAAGAAVALLCLTRGEAGPKSDDRGTGTEGDGRSLAEVRTAELAAAAKVLGVLDLVVLDHGDGMLPWADEAAIEADIHAAIERLRPDVVVTFGPDGLYWHPDHIAVCERTTAVVSSLGDAGPALYYVTMPPGQMREVARHAGVTSVVPGLADPDAFGAFAEPPTLVVEAGEFAARKLAALLCHRSQMMSGPIAAIAPADAARLLGTEHFRLVRARRHQPSFIEPFAASAG